ncbi:MAG: hypothetical protein RJA22_432 [Verrucomicrobiota bacterium]
MNLLSRRPALILLAGSLFCAPGLLHPASGPVPPAVLGPAGQARLGAALKRWNTRAVDASGLDHAGAREQLGPGRSSRAMAIVHLAVLDAVLAVTGGGGSYTGVAATQWPVSLEVAVAQAAHDTLAALYPSQQAVLAAALRQELAAERNRVARAHGVALGRRTAAVLLALKSNDGSDVPEPLVGVGHMTSEWPGRWRVDPISQIPVALGAKWGQCIPFVLESTDQFRAPPPPALASPAYAAAYEEVRVLGGDGVGTPTRRTAEQSFIGVFWAYDGTPSLCAPPRLYNQVARAVAEQMGTGGVDLARLLALVNVAMADAAMACWESKWHWDFWRPVTGIRESDPGTGPTGWGDGNPATVGDRGWTPLGAPASNLGVPDFTPPFPSYPSGHAAFGGAVFQVLRRFYGTDRIPFTLVSDEFNGVTRDSHGRVRPFRPRRFATLSEAEEENGQSRIYLGIHWAFDKTEGILQGRRVGDHVFDRLVPTPVRRVR